TPQDRVAGNTYWTFWCDTLRLSCAGKLRRAPLSPHWSSPMLVRLFGSNFRSIKRAFELSMVAADLKREEDRDRGIIEVPITCMIEPLRLLRTVAIYGPNASGKSTVITAAQALLRTDS